LQTTGTHFAGWGMFVCVAAPITTTKKGLTEMLGKRLEGGKPTHVNKYLLCIRKTGHVNKSWLMKTFVDFKTYYRPKRITGGKGNQNNLVRK